MTREQINLLSERIASGTATDEEIALYNRVCNAFAQPQEWDEALMGDRDALATDMFASISAAADAAPKVVKVRRARWAALAAAVLLPVIMLLSYWLLWPAKKVFSKPVDTTQSDRFKNNVAPGHGGAILTLSTGEKIVLDTALNGALATDGGSKIVKRDGVVRYELNTKGETAVMNTMTTPRGREYKLILPDGTTAWLNAASSISFPTFFSGTARIVIITGEVYFEVKHNDKMPFIVEQDSTQIEVLGTHFNVNAYADDRQTKTTLLEGSIKISSGDMTTAMKPGQQAQVKSHAITLINNADTSTTMAWKNGYFDFKGLPLMMLMKQLSRWYDIEYEGKAKEEELFYGKIPKNTTLVDMLTALELTGKVRFAITGRTIRIM